MNSVTPSLRADISLERDILSRLQERIGSQKFNVWFRHGMRLMLEDGRVQVVVPNVFVAKWIESHYLTDLAEACEFLLKEPTPVLVVVDPSLSQGINQRQLDAQAQTVQQAAQGRQRTVPASQAIRYSLGDFVVGSSNMLAYSAATTVAGATKPPFHHLFIHGPCGVGKTHLLQGICNAFGRLRGPNGPMAWRFVTGEQFTNEFVSAIRRKASSEFRDQYRRLDLLAIDDVHFLAGKKATQEEFLHTFNAIESAGKRIILASDAHPRMVGEINEQLVSRFVAGMVVRVDSPDDALRMEILRRKSAALKLHVPADVMEFVAMQIRGSVRELEGALIKLAALSALKEGPLTLSMANAALADQFARTGSAITLGDIEAAVGAFFGLTAADLHSSRRTRTVSVARMVTMFLARRHTTMSFPEIGRFMGKNHSSVVLAAQRMEALITGEADLEWMTPVGPKSAPAQRVVQLLTEQFA